MQMIPISLMDEHNDAFYHWNVFCERGYILKENNYLLHIDHHSDSEFGAYDWDLRHMPKTAAEALRFTDQCLGIADFIIPAIYQGLFSTFHTVKNVLPCTITEEEHFVKLSGENVLFSGKYIPFVHAARKTDSNYRFFLNRSNGLKGPDDLKGADSLVIDVDLDYFCWDDSLKSVPVKRIEITEQAFQEFCTDRNHPFQILPKKLLSVSCEDGRFFLEYREKYPQTPSASDKRILERIDRLLHWLAGTKVTPRAIDVCRSSYSGYLPSDKAEFVEKNFLKRLEEIYELSYIAIDYQK